MKNPLQLSKARSLKAIISAFIMASTALTANAQNYFEFTFGNPGTQYERFNSGTYFGGDLVGAGYATSPSGAYIVRVDAGTGQYLWQTRLGDATEVNSIQNTADGNMILGGTKLNGSNSNKMALTKINGNGGWLWTKTFSSAFQCQAEKAIQTSDGGYAIFGIRDWDLINQFASGKLYMVKTNSSGDSLWAKNYGVPAGWQRGHDMIELSGGGYMLCGESYNSVSTIGGSIVIRTNSVGDTLWTRTVGTGYDGAKKLIQSGSYIYVLNQLSMNSQGQILRFDLNGNHIVLSNLPNNVGVGGFVKNQGGSFSVALSDYNSDNVKIYNVNTSGVAQLLHTFSGDYQLDANQLIPTWTSQLAVFGRDYDYQVGAEDAWVASFDTLGNVQQITNCSVEIGVSDTTVCQGAYIPNPQPTGQAPFTYYWTPPIGMSNPNIANPVIEDVFNQQYTLVVTDANGCTAVDNVIVTSYTTSSDSVFMCNNNTATLNLGPGSTYQWLNFLDTLGNYTQLNQTTQSITVTQPGTYTALEYTQGCGVLTSQFFVGLCEDACTNAWNLFNYTHMPFCGGDSIFFVGTGGQQIVSWQWYASPDIFSTTSTGWLVLTQNTPRLVELITIDANNCTAYSSMTVTPIISYIDVDAGQDTVICNGSYTATAQATGGSGNYTYLWEPQSYFLNPTLQSQTFSNVYNETFWVWATDINGCTSLDTIVVSALQGNSSNDTVYLCNSQAYLLLPTGAQYYNWSNGSTTAGIVVNATGTYSGYGYFQGCGTVVKTFHVLPCNTNCFNVFTYQHNPWACGDSVLFAGTGGTQIVNWTWDFGDGHIETNSQPTVYHYYLPANGVAYLVTLTTTDINGCTTTSYNNIVIQGGTPVTVNAGNDYTICQPGTYQLNASATGGTGIYTYQWFPATGLNATGIANPLAIVQGPICYTVTAYSEGGCYDIDTICLDYIHPVNDTVYLCNSTVELCVQEGAFNYIWTTTGEQTNCITVSDTGTYFAYAWFGGCPTTSNYYTVLPCEQTCFNDFNYQSNPWACGDSVLFNANASAQCFVYMWDFGDGSTFNSNLATLYHYYSAGTYTVTLTTIDVNGCTSVTTQTITISDGFEVNITAYYSNVEEWNINNGSNITTCGGTLYDSGGSNGNYQNNENLAFTVYPATQGNVTSLNFSYFNSETNYDFITIYNNNSASGTILYGPASGSLSIGTITANFTNNPTGALTIKFTTDFSIVLGGFEAAVSCQAPNGQPQYPDSIFACQGVAHLNATPTVPGNYFYQWSPSTGLDNPYIANPVASMVNNMQYTVTVTDVNTGCSSTDDIVVTSYTFIVDTFEVCGDSITLDFGPGATQYYWQYYTDPQGNGSGLNLYTQTINVINPGTYFGYAYYPGCGALTSLFHVVACETDSVWPGDANADGQAHNMDLLTIGIGYGTNGLLRPNATINWQPEASPAWGQQLVSGVDYKHIDCNGDAVIDVNDTLAVIQNYGSLHSFNGIETRSDNDPMLYLTAPVDTVLTGTSVVVLVNLGTDTVHATDVYGIGFTVHYNPDLLQANSMGISFNNSWFGVHGLNAISIRKNFHAQGMMDVALTRIDHQNISGHGTIGELNFITIDNLSGKETLYQTLDLYITDVKLIRNNEDEVQLGIQNDSIVVTNLGISVHELNSLEAGISVYPNPTKDVLNVVIESTAFGQQTTAEILNATGQVISISTLTSNISSLNVSDLAAGIYFVRISSEQGSVSKRFTVIK